MGQKKQNKLMSWVVVAVVILAIAVASLSFNLKDSATSGQDIQTITQAGGKAQFCANNPALDLNVRVRDSLSSSRSYMENATILIQNLDTGSIVSHTVGDGTSSFSTVSNVFDCNSEKGYDIYVQAGENFNSDDVTRIKADDLSRTPIEVTIDASLYSGYKVRAYDNVEKLRLTEATTNSTDYIETNDVVFNSGVAGVTFSNNTEAMDVTFTLAPITNNRAKGTGLLIALSTEDASHIEDFDESLTQVWFNGVLLREATGLSEHELRALNGYEIIYKVDDTIGMDSKGSKVSQSTLRVFLQPESEATSKSFNPVIKIVALGDYESMRGDEVLRSVGFRDDASRTELYTAQTITLAVN